MSSLYRPLLMTSRFKKILLCGAALFSSLLLQAQAPVPDAMDDPWVVAMVIMIGFLALIIILLAWIVLGSAQVFLQKEKEEKAAAEKLSAGQAGEEKKSQAAAVALSVIALLLPGLSLHAEDTGPAMASGIHTMGDTAFYMLAGVIFLELVVILALLFNLRTLIDIRKKKTAPAAEAAKPALHWWNKMNRFKPIEQEVSIDLGHDYDGIRELDNRLPPWWLYGFYCSILFACIYLWRYHVAHTAPLSGEEYQLAVQQAEVKKAEYLKKAANNVDENTVKYLTAGADLAAGQKIFETTCFACHGKLGEGGVGPNLTDDYWLHGGGIKDIFRTIKYGVPEKGMKSWKDDYSPGQIAQIASYIKSLKGTNPPNSKAPQGNLSKDDAAPVADSATTGPAATATP